MSGSVKKAAITGHPVTHSRSPLVHGYWLKKHGIEGEYGRIDVPPETAENFYRNFAASGLSGANVTVPNKEVAAAACGWLDDAAKSMGAANTIWLDDKGRLCGANTDGLGFLGNLDQLAPGWDVSRESAVVLGAGGLRVPSCGHCFPENSQQCISSTGHSKRQKPLPISLAPERLPMNGISWEQFLNKLNCWSIPPRSA